MAKAETRPKAKRAKEKDVETVTALAARDAPGLSPLERMTELTRRIINVPKDEVDKKRRGNHPG